MCFVLRRSELTLRFKHVEQSRPITQKIDKRHENDIEMIGGRLTLKCSPCLFWCGLAFYQSLFQFYFEGNLRKHQPRWYQCQS